MFDDLKFAPKTEDEMEDFRDYGDEGDDLDSKLDNYEDGETYFPKLQSGFKGRKGDALIFWNVTPDGLPDPLTLHMGSAPTRGEEWLFSQWIRTPA